MVNLFFEVKFRGAPAIRCSLFDTELSRRYIELIKKQTDTPIFRDPPRYTLEYLKELAIDAQRVLEWDWIKDVYSLDITTRLHKDIEQYLAKGFENIPEEHDHLLHELHYCLHSVESGSKRNSWLQVEWFNDQGFGIEADEYPAKVNLEFGDLRLQNPYVGHHPLYVYEQKDSINIEQTCKFHDFVKPGINIVVDPNDNKPSFDMDAYLKWFETNGSSFVAKHGIEKLKKFTGHPVVGTVINKNDLALLVQQPIIEFEYISFPT
jgi:hypothetical protein